MFRQRPLALLTCLLALSACEDDGTSSLIGSTGNPNGNANGADGGPMAEGGTAEGGPAGDGGTSGNPLADGGSTGSDASAEGGTSTGGDAGPYRDPSTITGIRKPTVKCGDTVCEGTTQVCCDPWREGGWEAPTCMEKSECNVLGNPPLPFAYPLSRDNGVRSSCDGPEDCGSGNADNPNVCCFVLTAPPHYTAGGVRVAGPGHGRECLPLSACMTESVDDAEPAAARPFGVISCTEDDHCKPAGDGLTCQPEAAEDESAGGIGPRPHVSLCK